MSQVRRKLHAVGAYLYKPFRYDYRRAQDAPEQLQGRLEETLKELKDKGIKDNEIQIGFADESSPQSYSNSVRLWSMSHEPMVVNVTRMRHNTFGFYSPAAKSMVRELADSKSESFVKMLSRIRKCNPGAKAIILLWDNFVSHKSAKVIKQAEQHNIYLVPLPAYAPDLNPIEYIWKEVRRAIGEKILIEDKPDLHNTIYKAFKKCARKISFAKGWMENILKPVANKLGLDFSHLFCA